MKTKLWYSVRNGGDGSAYPVLMESGAQCEIDQDLRYEVSRLERQLYEYRKRKSS